MIDKANRIHAREVLYGRPGLSGAALYDDCIEISGTPEDSDEVAGEISGTFTMKEARELIGPHLPLTDERSEVD